MARQGDGGLNMDHRSGHAIRASMDARLKSRRQDLIVSAAPPGDAVDHPAQRFTAGLAPKKVWR
jgi:hypothetical protein